MVKAWRFDPQPLLLDVLATQLSYDATPRAVLLSATDAAAAMSLNTVEVELPITEQLTKARLLDQAVGATRPTTGPTPSSWTGPAGRDVNRVTYTYAARFGKTDIWKIGHAIDVGGRVRNQLAHPVRSGAGSVAYTIN